MTKAKVWRKGNYISRVKVSGHSGYADFGKDIVCSAISTAMIMTANLLEKFDCKCNVIFDEENTDIDIEIVEFYNKDDASIKIMLNLVESLLSISTQYPKNFELKFLEQKQ